MYYKSHKTITDKSDEISKETKENTTEMRKLNHKVDNLESVIKIAIEKALEKTKGQTLADGNQIICLSYIISYRYIATFQTVTSR